MATVRPCLADSCLGDFKDTRRWDELSDEDVQACFSRDMEIEAVGLEREVQANEVANISGGR